MALRPLNQALVSFCSYNVVLLHDCFVVVVFSFVTISQTIDWEGCGVFCTSQDTGWEELYILNDLQVLQCVSWLLVTVVVLLGRTYNIPVCLWLLDTYPYNPPMIFVKPTANMQIKPGRHVDMSGRIYLPYLHEWKHVCTVRSSSQVFALCLGVLRRQSHLRSDLATLCGSHSLVTTY